MSPSLEEQVQTVFVGRKVADCGYESPTFVVEYKYSGENDEYNGSSLLVRHVAGDQWINGLDLELRSCTLEEIRDAWYAQIINEMREHLTSIQTLLHNTVKELTSAVAPKKGTLVFVRNNKGWVVGDNEVYVFPATSDNRWRAGSKDVPMQVGNTPQEAIDKVFAAMPSMVTTLTIEADDYRQAAVRVADLLERAGIEYVPGGDTITEE